MNANPVHPLVPRALFTLAMAALAACQAAPSVSVGGGTTTTETVVNVMVTQPPVAGAPIITAFDYSPKASVGKDDIISFTLAANSPSGRGLAYTWTCTKGDLTSNSGAAVGWKPRKADGTLDSGRAVITVVVSDGAQTSSGSVNIHIDPSGAATVASATADATTAVAAAGAIPSSKRDDGDDGPDRRVVEPPPVSAPPVTGDGDGDGDGNTGGIQEEAIPGALDQDVAIPGGTPTTTVFGRTVVGDSPVSVHVGIPFTPSRDGSLTAFAPSLSTGKLPNGAATGVTIAATDERGMPTGTPLGATTIPAAKIRPFGLGRPYTTAIFKDPIPLKAGQLYIAVIDCASSPLSIMLTHKGMPNAQLRMSLADPGTPAWFWTAIPENGGFNWAVFRTYMAN